MKTNNALIAFWLRFGRVMVATALFILLVVLLIVGIAANDLTLKTISITGFVIWLFGISIIFDIGPVDDQGDIWDE